MKYPEKPDITSLFLMKPDPTYHNLNKADLSCINLT